MIITSKKTFCICIPTYNRLDLLIPSLMMYAIEMPDIDIFVYDDGCQMVSVNVLNSFLVDALMDTCNPKNIRYLYRVGEKTKSIGVAGAWNILMETAFKQYDYVLMLNDDVYLHTYEWTINSTIFMMETSGNDMFLCENKFDWSSFLISKKCFETVGCFDETFYPAYLEDMDYLYRMRLLRQQGKIKFDYIPSLNPTIFRRSSTLLKGGAIAEEINEAQVKNKNYYLQKWGGPVGAEIFKTEFGK